MEKQDFLNRLSEIGTCEDEVQRRELIASLQDDASKDYDNLTSLTEENSNLTTKNEELMQANMKLFLRVGESKNQDEVNKGNTGIDNKVPEKRQFKDLFNEKGGLK